MFGKKKRMQNTTLILHTILFEDFDHPRPAMTPEGIRIFMEPVVMDVVKQHYFEVLRPPKQWNYHCDLSYTAYMASQELAHLEFRDHETKEIANKASYKMFCSAMKDSLKKNLQSKFPAYDTEKLEDGFEETKYTYDKKRCTITVSVLLENIMEPDEAYNW